MSERLPIVSPRELGIDSERWNRAESLAAELVEQDVLPAVSFQLQYGGRATPIVSLGRRTLDDPSSAVDEETIFLVASLTKPIVATAVMRLVEEGRIGLGQRVLEFIPEFRDAAKRPITIRHLLTHTSGLPDMLPNNLELRRAKSSLEDFVAGTCKVDLDFPPGRGVQYQSMGYALLGGIIERVTKQSCGEYLRDAVLEPCGIKTAALGMDAASAVEAPIAECRVPPEQREGVDWNWNSPYWRGFGAPWGGLLARVEDLSLFCREMLSPSGAVLSPSVTTFSMGNRIADFPTIDESSRRCRAWGFGWRQNWVEHKFCFSDLLPAEVCGHWGATGTLFWLDRSRQASLVLVSTQPLDRESSPLIRLSNVIASALPEA